MIQYGKLFNQLQMKGAHGRTMKVAINTFMVCDHMSCTIRYFNTPIVRVYRNTIILNTGGNCSATVVKRLNAFLNGDYGNDRLPFKVSRIEFIPHLVSEETGAKIAFPDGGELNINHNALLRWGMIKETI